MKAGTRVRPANRGGPAIGTVVKIDADLLNGYDIAVQWDSDDPQWPTCVNRDEVEEPQA